MEKRTILQSAIIFLSIVGPGIITATVDNDAGGITTYSLAGANFGYTLLWTMLPVLLMLILVQEMCARLGVVTGKGLADLIRENFPLRLTFITMLLLLIVNIANTITEFAGIAAASEILGVSRYIALPLSGIAVWWLIVKGNYKSVEKIFLAACFFYIAYVLSGFIAHPSWDTVFHASVVPTIKFEKSYLIMIVGIVGTTIAPWMQFYMQSSVVEKQIKKEEYLFSKIDVILGCIISVVVAFFIVLTTAGTIFRAGVPIETAKDAALALLPLAGKYATYLFAFGLLNASLFAASILPLSTAYSISEALGWENGVNRKFDEAKQFYVLYSIMIVIGIAFVMLPGFSLVTLMYFSQVLNGVLLPVIIILMLILINKKELMGGYTNSRIYNLVAWAVSLIIIALDLVMLFSLVF
jgi:NRAMP (natural resistance-associated macrophage protein)-like metal ion transporter